MKITPNTWHYTSFLVLTSIAYYLVKSFNSPNIFFLVILLSQFLTFLYAISNVNFKKTQLKTLIIQAIAIHLILIPAYKMPSDDIHTYIFTSRIISVYNENPYIKTYDEFPEDKLYSKINTIWSNKTRVYGPLVFSIGSQFSKIAGDTYAANILAFKIMAILFSLLSSVTIFLITKNTKSFFAFALNPLVLFSVAINAHNDIIMIFFFLLSIYFLKKKSHYMLLFGWIFLVLSILSKYQTIFFAPLLLIYAIKKIKKTKYQAIYFFLFGLIGVLITAATFYQYWQGPMIFERLSLIARSNFNYKSPMMALLENITSEQSAKKNARIAFYLAYTTLIIKSVIYKVNFKKLINTLLILSTFFYLLFLNLLMPWYLTLLIAISALAIVESKGQNFYRKYALHFATSYSLILYFNIYL